MHKTVYAAKAIKDTVNKKQLLIFLPFLGAQSFLVLVVFRNDYKVV